ncbi:glycosyltransferase [Lactococcus piscium]|uniref:glycosyltransferase family 2 protein n=1 Tax=Pseudolactococcus carnosus TaxID=2749961 RepID=UPI001FBB7FF9|nr:glycosyltransferase family 2 protein [Lactococcus carnosus]MCJ1995241.1 glycosyltransferase [Lactococcus carnosus]
MFFLRDLISNDINSLQIMKNTILIGLIIVFIYVIVLKALELFRNNEKLSYNEVVTVKTINEINKKSVLYITILIIWLVQCLSGLTSLIINISFYEHISLSFGKIILLIVNVTFISYFWLNGIKDLVYSFFYRLKNYAKIEKEILEFKIPTDVSNSKIVALYCTCDDFIEESLLKSMNQNYRNFRVVILDDSNNVGYKKRIDIFSSKYDIEVIRRSDRKGFKAGNLNNYLKDRTDYDYFIILDSDEIIPTDFCENSLKYFFYYENIGIVQANHISTRDRTKFMDRFSLGVNSHWPTYQGIKNEYGFMSFLGHGALISRECFQSVKSFPELVSEDLCFSIEARLKGYYVAFAQGIICEEEYPIDYFAFKKRHLKWTGGNLEFIKKYSSKLFKSSTLKWFEKLDVVLFTFSLPMSSAFFLFLTINLIIFSILHMSAGYPLWLMVPTVICLFAPIINDMVYVWGKYPLLKSIGYLFSSFLLYGSLYWISFYGATKAWFGVKAKFIVTPKENKSYTLLDTLRGNFQEVCFSGSLIFISVYFTHSLLPVILIVFPSLSGMYLTHLSKPKKTKSFSHR